MKNQAVTAPARNGGILEQVIINGDLSKITAEERVEYYRRVCESVGLNPLTNPFAYITLNGKLTLYALRACTDQLRTIHGVSVEELVESERDGVFVVTAKVRNRDGRTDMAKGAVPIQGLKGDALANALMKCETKAKRRATLSICGLGMLDETEIETIPGASRAPNGNGHTLPPPPQIEAPHDPVTGEVLPHAIAVPLKDNKPDWTQFGIQLLAGAKSATTEAIFDEWMRLNGAPLTNCSQQDLKVHSRLALALEKVRADHFYPVEQDAGLDEPNTILAAG